MMNEWTQAKYHIMKLSLWYICTAHWMESTCNVHMHCLLTLHVTSLQLMPDICSQSMTQSMYAYVKQERVVWKLQTTFSNLSCSFKKNRRPRVIEDLHKVTRPGHYMSYLCLSSSVKFSSCIELLIQWTSSSPGFLTGKGKNEWQSLHCRVVWLPGTCTSPDKRIHTYVIDHYLRTTSVYLRSLSLELRIHCSEIITVREVCVPGTSSPD